jgi:hypothetical protein
MANMRPTNPRIPPIIKGSADFVLSAFGLRDTMHPIPDEHKTQDKIIRIENCLPLKHLGGIR